VDGNRYPTRIELHPVDDGGFTAAESNAVFVVNGLGVGSPGKVHRVRRHVDGTHYMTVVSGRLFDELVAADYDAGNLSPGDDLVIDGHAFTVRAGASGGCPALVPTAPLDRRYELRWATTSSYEATLTALDLADLLGVSVEDLETEDPSGIASMGDGMLLDKLAEVEEQHHLRPGLTTRELEDEGIARLS